ncbi:glycine cleavage system protein H [Streptococcus acidominimus]|uniref:Glycine cleavage system H protein n=1 Tax=Streptococcus acidominimus TaxID=1326 RepID=A0A1Q8ECN6_STRAI|nr:glycine cleavage system protein H [Streptococcus acidominimus]MBF0848388.1 glycine cleavage system protein H [Streptococcus danieliae]MBF0818257.1 glycine cleavage system protein H [Streptococcus acidominimus]MBF0838574.1 glycine cleavage system protein H [Streptococcus acidominimus]OLF49547.1 glycine cleavage system protein H [Streptococcus acidominimus]TFU31576.1 glycine cleavage system protein H [Streptococcus acidominimus]
MKKIANYLWIEQEEDHYVISMTPELQDDIGTIGYVEFSEGDYLEKDDVILNLEASKTVMAILSPLAGKVLERNTAALEEPLLLNSAKPDEHWLVKLTDVDSLAFEALEDA